MTGKKVAVLCGGDGREREVSLRSGKAVCDALNEADFHAALIDLKSLAEAERLSGYDGVFIAMHGDWGEGGQLQAKLEAMNISYTGSGPAASMSAMNKWTACEVFMKAGITFPEGVLMPAGFEEIVSRLGRDVVVKPCSGGSTVGLTIIHDLTPENLDEAVRAAKGSYDSDVMVEKYIPGKELTCAVWEHDGRTEALPVIEIAPHTGFYDYANKYTSGATDYIVPAKSLTPEEFANVQAMAVKAHEALGCSGYSRADFRLAPDGKAYILEVNTAPGMTGTSLVPKAAKAIGVSMSEFVSEIMSSASCGKR
ncbi:MAG: D-alanine--D-alanine ligase [Synergistaceae bacterium]|nr:D-alanine--D-alanine ligase [Synergistaceae bacterium]